MSNHSLETTLLRFDKELPYIHLVPIATGIVFIKETEMSSVNSDYVIIYRTPTHVGLTKGEVNTMYKENKLIDIATVSEYLACNVDTLMRVKFEVAREIITHLYGSNYEAIW